MRRDVVVVLIQCLVHLSQGGGEEGGTGSSLLCSTKVVHIARGSPISLHLPLDFSVCCPPCPPHCLTSLCHSDTAHLDHWVHSHLSHSHSPHPPLCPDGLPLRCCRRQTPLDAVSAMSVAVASVAPALVGPALAATASVVAVAAASVVVALVVAA